MEFKLNPEGAIINDDADTETRDIVFPHQLEDLSQIAVDVGGSLAKVVWFSRSQDSPGGRLNFVKFETQHIDQCVDFIYKVLYDNYDGQVQLSKRIVKATGGGAHKFYDLFKSKLGVTIHREDEMECLITGLNFLVRQIPDEVFTYDERRNEAMLFEPTPSEIFPYMLVNIGSGVSILKVTSDETYERISGTSLGGGTLWGLLSLLTDAKSYDEMLDLSKDGDNRNVDMLVGDIYGGDYSKVGLKASTIASSFGKVFKASPADRKNFKQEDISRSLLYLVSNNIGQIAYLNAQAHGVQRIYFSGFFIRGHAVTMNTLNYAINFWSKGKIKALFLRHEGYLGAMGAFLRNATPRRRSISFQVLENFSQVERISGTSPSAVGAIEVMSNIRAFPLLRDVQTYTPETTDLASDPRLQHYWLDLLDKNLSDLVTMVVEWQLKEDGRKNGSEEALKARAVSFESMYRNHLQRLRREPNAYGVLTIRSLLNLREQCLREMGFTDVFEGVKKKENAAAMPMFFELVKEIDLLPEDEQIKALTDNVLAGNMYDWGYVQLFFGKPLSSRLTPQTRSTTIQEMLKKGQLGFDLAKEKVQHPAKFNHLSRLQKRLLSPPPYRKAIVFVDNSGADAILGILPFVRYLVKKGTRVILAANTRPAVNDITAYELDGVLSEVAKQDGLLAEAVKKSWIKVVGTGSGEPCLDLRRVSEQIASEATDTDLVILEGMGRAIHTNFFAKFRVDCLKIAVFKNPQVAEQLGAQMYDGIRIFEQV